MIEQKSLCSWVRSILVTPYSPVHPLLICNFCPNPRRRAKYAGAVEGIAQSQTRMEIRQSGPLIHTSLVPGGTFLLPNIELLNGNSDQEVTVIENNGN
ncbi:fimbria/pilus outer membrane usher protein [Pseudomonas zeae]|uniref:fimbria/pilus outer membrane usher protein n=1 Tax=Pseudomonas zeae TaxID=2745510 RepID=UPI0039E07902